MFENWKVVIGLEIHAQLLTSSKLFSTDSAHFIDKENTHIHPVSIGLPGTLPVLNKKAIEYASQVGLALNCRINTHSVFARKNYFYPDLPKGYQISQYAEPLCEAGYIEFDCEGKKKKVRINRVHVEEDAGRFHHRQGCSLVNFNRSSVPLVEIVSEPDLSSPKEAGEMVRTLRRILRYLKVCDGNLEEGSLRCDCNVSINKISDNKLGTRTEIKNVNSFKFIEKSIEYEIQRQIHVLESGESVVLETRLYDSAKNKTFSLRSKEEASDYRYFPDPDLPPVLLADEWIKEQQKKIPELFLQKVERFQNEYQLSQQEAALIADEQDRANYFEKMVVVSQDTKLSANWLINEVLARLNEEKKQIGQCPVSPENLGDMVRMISKKEISGKIGKRVFIEMWNSGLKVDSKVEGGKSCKQIVDELGLKKITDEQMLSNMVEGVLKKFPKQVEDYKQGKHKIFGFFIGELMKQSKGQAGSRNFKSYFTRKTKILTIATIDIGSNTSLLLIARFSGNSLKKLPEVLVDQIFFTRLAEGVSQKREIKKSALERQEIFFQKAQNLISRYSVNKVRCVATASARLAQNSDELLDLAKKYGFFIDIISAENEAQISRYGALFDLSVEPTKQVVVLDIGGASTEISTETQFFSLNMGSVSLTENLLHQDPPSQTELKNLKESVLAEINTLPKTVFHKNSILVATAGIPTTLMALEKKQTEIKQIHGNILNGCQIQRWYKDLTHLNIREKKNLPDMPVYRADVIIAGVSILKEIMNYFQWEQCIVSTTGLRYGLLYH